MRLKFIPDKINYAIFYGNPDNEEPNIAHSLLTMLASLPTECIGPIAANIVLAGGLWRIKGMQKLLKKRVAEHIPQFSKLTNMHIK
jgi:actin-related protein